VGSLIRTQITLGTKHARKQYRVYFILEELAHSEEESSLEEGSG